MKNSFEKVTAKITWELNESIIPYLDILIKNNTVEPEKKEPKKEEKK